MASAARFTVSTTPVRLDTAAGSDNIRGRKVVIRNVNTAPADEVSLGASNVAAATGYRLAGAQTLTVDLSDSESLYAVRTTAADVAVDVLFLS